MFKRFIFRLVLPVVLLAAAMQSPAVAANNFWVDQASSGSPRAQYNLARMYLWGMKELDIPQNNKEAYKWFLESAEQGFAASQYEVGISLQAGRGVARDAQAAQVWFKKAADQGYANAKPTMSRVAGGRRGSASVLTSTSIPPGEILSLIGGLGVESVSHSITNVKFFNGWWSWWLGAFALGFITISFWLTTRVTLGVSSSWDRLVGWKDDRRLNEADALMRSTPADDLAAALMAETLAEFGDEVPESMKKSLTSDSDSTAMPARTERRTSWTVHVTFLAANVIGGFLAYVLAGNWQLHMDMGTEFTSLFGSGPESMVVLLVGGILVGFGTRLGGGCTSGHGLSGCSRMQTGSLVGTASFFGTAIIVSFLIDLFLG